MLVAEWLRFSELVGGISIDKFLKLPGRFVNAVFYIKAAEHLKQLKLELMDCKDKDQRYKLQLAIDKLETTFDE